jgi:hypothetical protein
MGRLLHFVRPYAFSFIWEELMPMSQLHIQNFIVYFDNNLQELLLRSIVNHAGNYVILEFVNHVENCFILGFVSHVENCVILGFVSNVENCVILGFFVWGLEEGYTQSI